FQAEDGIRDFHVTGVQTCALPISGMACMLYLWVSEVGITEFSSEKRFSDETSLANVLDGLMQVYMAFAVCVLSFWRKGGSRVLRSEERRVGKGCRGRGMMYVDIDE